MNPSGQDAGGSHQWHERWEDQWADVASADSFGHGALQDTRRMPRGDADDPAAGDGATDPPARRLELLSRTVERAIIPRLVLAGQVGQSTRQPSRSEGWCPSEVDVEHLAGLVIAHEPAYVVSFVETLWNRGATLETLYLDLLAPTARRLGDMWCEDLCDFTQVTMGLWCLHQVLHAFSHAFQAEDRQPQNGWRILLAPAPGEQHTFGLGMVAEFFRRDGWQVVAGMQATAAELADLVRRQWFSVVGLSVGGEVKLEPIGQCIRMVRDASRNPTLGVLLGGPLLLDRPELARLVGADATATDARHATRQAARLVTLLGMAG